MSKLFDFHIHSTHSDGRVSLEERAATVAVRPHGLSDHFPYGTHFRSDDDVLRYLDRAAKLGLKVGIEYDLGVAPELRPTTRDALDYVIGSVHQVHRGAERIRYDGAGDFLKRGKSGGYAERDRFAEPTLRALILEQTIALISEGIERHGIGIVGHPTFTPLAALGNPEDAYPAEWQDRLIALCVRNGVALEVNESYQVPHREFLERARRAGARFSVGSDTHGPLGSLDRTQAMIEAASLDPGQFLVGGRVRSVVAESVAESVGKRESPASSS